MNEKEKTSIAPAGDGGANLRQRFAAFKIALFGDNRFWSIDGTHTASYLMPLRLTLIYLLASILVYMFGPLAWTTYRPVLFYFLLAFYLVAFWFGYRVGLMRKAPENPVDWDKISEKKIEKIILIGSILIVVNFFVYVINIFRDYNLTTLDFPELFRQMWVGIKNPGLGYNLRLERLDNAANIGAMGGALFTLFNYVWAFVRYPVLILSMVYFKRLKIYGKIFAVLYLALMLVFYMSIGTNIDVFHIFLFIILPSMLEIFSLWHKRLLTKKKLLGFIAVVLAALLLMAGYFTWMMVSRGGINDYDKPGYNVSGVILKDDVVNSTPSTDKTPSSDETQKDPTSNPDTSGGILPPIVMKFWISFASYFSQGYYGMSQALTVPWTPMFGVGNSMFAVDFISEHVTDIDPYTYQVKVENAYGWGADMRWHSIYTWLANDVSFYGVIVVMFLLGVLFAMMFKDAITTKNPFAKASVFYFVLFAIFIPCNNQLAQRADTLFSFVLLVVCWIISRYPPKKLEKWLNGVEKEQEDTVC